MYNQFSIAIGPTPNIMRRTSREASGDVVLGFAITREPEGPYQDRITCEMLNAGSFFSDATLKACLDALCTQFGQTNVEHAVRAWIQERCSAEVPLWARTF